MGRLAIDAISILSLAVPVFAITIWIVYLFALAIYRLYFSPIAKFPGPKLAAVSKWYELYYQVPCRGMFSAKISELHDKYGPIVRITPSELHIRDSDYYDELYGTPKQDRDPWFSPRSAPTGTNVSVLTTHSHDHWRVRRTVLNPFFSRRSVVGFQPLIREKVELLCSQLAKYREGSESVNLIDAFATFSCDVITDYCFGFCNEQLRSPDFKDNLHTPFYALTEFGQLVAHFPWLGPLVDSLPDSVNIALNPPLATLVRLKKRLVSTIKAIKNDAKSEKTSASGHPTIFHEVLQSDLADSEKTERRLGEEAQLLIGAGLLTTSWCLTVGIFYLLSQPSALEKLRVELNKALPTPDSELSWTELEKLPYLSAVIRESLRISYGISTRSPRVVPYKDLHYGEWTIPAGTSISMTIVDVCHDEAIFPDSHSFRPERWLGNPRAPNGAPLEKYQVNFQKGPRSCLGIKYVKNELVSVFML
ncbi:MAG: hypothetical protein M1820_000174 [Bogoriella megaspora]|nr:MAG: hypothetical protein M1820_000174 [Bogoriella megaspora]